jgi:phage portal protein BeeE
MQIVSGGVMQPVLGYRVYSNRAYSAQEYDFKGDTVSHLKYFNPFYTTYGSQLYGQAPLRAYLETLQRSKDSRNELNKQAKNGGPMGVWSPKTSSGAPPIDNPKVKADIKMQLGEAQSSSELAKRIIVASAEGAWQQIGLPSTDLQLVESLGLTTKDICKAFHLPIQSLDSSTGATDNNMGWAAKKVVYDAVMPLGGIIEDRLTRDLCVPHQKSGSKLFLMFDYSALPEMQQDQVATAGWLNTSWWMTGNEKRAQQGLQRSTEPMMDTPLVPSTYVPITDLSMTAENFTQAGNANSTL